MDSWASSACSDSWVALRDLGGCRLKRSSIRWFPYLSEALSSIMRHDLSKKMRIYQTFSTICSWSSRWTLDTQNFNGNRREQWTNNPVSIYFYTNKRNRIRKSDESVWKKILFLETHKIGPYKRIWFIFYELIETIKLPGYLYLCRTVGAVFLHASSPNWIE